MEALSFEVPEEVLRAIKLPPGDVAEELQKELALALYERGALASGKARKLARMTRWQFHEFLGKRRTTRHYGQEDLTEDVRYARGDR